MSGFYSAGTILGLEDYKLAIIAVIGCGGKTTFIASFADEYRHKKVLITPTTKILPMCSEEIILRRKQHECLSHDPKIGVQCLGVLNETTGKLEALRQDELEVMIPGYDLVLLEADGSNGLPCKGWLPDEPVIPSFCTHTIGIVTLNGMGKAADDYTVMRMLEFSNLTGLRRGETISLQALTGMVCTENGMFRRGCGRQGIFVNQVEDYTGATAAEKWLRDIEEANPGRFTCTAYGSARTNRWRNVLPCSQSAL